MNTKVDEVKPSPALSDYPNIILAAKEIWYDNGMINRAEPEEQKLQLLGEWLTKQDKGMLSHVELDLANKDLQIICCGEESEALPLASEETHNFLGQIFDEEYEPTFTQGEGHE